MMHAARVFCHGALAVTVAGGTTLMGACRSWLWRDMGVGLARMTGAWKVWT